MAADFVATTEPSNNPVVGEAGSLRRPRGSRSSSQIEMEYGGRVHGQHTAASFHPPVETSFHSARPGGTHCAPPRAGINGKNDAIGHAPGGSGNSACCCFSAQCRKQNGSLIAATIGLISLTCLLSAIVTDTWIHTEESLTSPVSISSSSSSSALSSSISDNEYIQPSFDTANKMLRVHFTVGLWKVCYSGKTYSLC